MFTIVAAGSDALPVAQSKPSASVPAVNRYIDDRYLIALNNSYKSFVPTATISTGFKFWEIERAAIGVDNFVGLLDNGVALNVDPRSYLSFSQRQNGTQNADVGTNTWSVSTNTAAMTTALASTIQIVVDTVNKKCWIGQGGNFGTGNPATGANPHFHSWTGTPTFKPFVGLYYQNEAAMAQIYPRVYTSPPAGCEYLT